MGYVKFGVGIHRPIFFFVHGVSICECAFGVSSSREKEAEQLSSLPVSLARRSLADRLKEIKT